MASVGCVAALNSSAKLGPHTKKHYFGIFQSKIQMQKDILRPYGVLNGKLIINNPKEIQCGGIRVQLDGNVILKYDSKVDSRSTIMQKMEGIIEGSELLGGNYVLSPIRQQIIGKDDEEDRGQGDILIPPGSHVYTFSLAIPMQKLQLPAPFGSKFGSLQYKVTAYMKTHWRQIQISESQLRFNGYNNLSELDNYLEPMKHESGLQKSIFSSKKIITGAFTVERRGFLPGEEIVYNLGITNAKGLSVKKISVNLVRRVVYDVDGTTKTTLLILDAKDITEPNDEMDINIIDKLKVPISCVPSYTGKSLYTVSHLVQYHVKVAGQPGLLKGQIDIVIGSTKEPVKILMARMSSLSLRSDSTEVKASDVVD